MEALGDMVPHGATLKNSELPYVLGLCDSRLSQLGRQLSHNYKLWPAQHKGEMQ